MDINRLRSHTRKLILYVKMVNIHFLGIFLASTAYGAQLRLLSYNMYGWNAMGTEAWKKENLFKTIRAAAPGKCSAAYR